MHRNLQIAILQSMRTGTTYSEMPYALYEFQESRGKRFEDAGHKNEFESTQSSHHHSTRVRVINLHIIENCTRLHCNSHGVTDVTIGTFKLFSLLTHLINCYISNLFSLQAEPTIQTKITKQIQSNSRYVL